MDQAVRAFLCGQCGSPGWTAWNLLSVSCRFCGASIQIAPRAYPSKGAALPPGLLQQHPEEAERYQRLRAQANGSERSRYDLDRTIAGLGELEHLGLEDPQGPARFAQAFLQSRAALPTRSIPRVAEGVYRAPADRQTAAPEEEKRLVWIASRAVSWFGRKGQGVEARPWCEQALDLVTDPGLQHLLCCQLSCLARWAGAIDAAEAWLQLCDPRPWDLELDSAYRVNYGLLLAARGQWSEVLSAVGPALESLPAEHGSSVALGLLRVAAQEALGAAETADDELRKLLDISLEADLDDLLNREPAIQGARPVLGRYREQLARRRAKRRKAELLVAAIAGGVGVLVSLLSPLIIWNGRNTEIVCMRAAAQEPTCTITRRIGGSLVETVTVKGLRRADLDVTTSRNKKSYQIFLRTSTGTLDLNVLRCTGCGKKLESIAEELNRFAGDSKSTPIHAVPDNDPFVQFFGLAVGFLGLGIIGFGLLRAWAAMFRKS